MAFECAKLGGLYCVDVRDSELVVEGDTGRTEFASTDAEIAEFELEEIRQL